MDCRINLIVLPHLELVGFFIGEKMKIKISQVIDLKPTRRIRTPQGFMICVGVNLAKPMIKEYYAGELGINDYKPTDIVSIYTSPETLFHQNVIDGFDGSDVVMTHPDGNQLNSNNYKQHIIGTAKNARAEDGYLVADLVIKDRWSIEAIEYDDIKQISLGYSAELDLTQGKTETGQIYHGQWLNMVADHVAVVREGRCGQDCSIGDQQNTKQRGDFMKVKIGNLEFDVADSTLAQAISNQNSELDMLKQSQIKIGEQSFGISELKATQATIDKLVADKKTLAEENAELKAKAITAEQVEQLVADRVKTIAEAKQINSQIVTDGKTVDAIKREIVTSKADDNLVYAIVGDNVKDAEQSVINTAFKVLVATANSQQNATDIALSGLNVGDSKSEDKKTFDKSMMWKGE